MSENTKVNLDRLAWCTSGGTWHDAAHFIWKYIRTFQYFCFHAVIYWQSFTLKCFWKLLAQQLFTLSNLHPSFLPHLLTEGGEPSPLYPTSHNNIKPSQLRARPRQDLSCHSPCCCCSPPWYRSSSSGPTLQHEGTRKPTHPTPVSGQSPFAPRSPHHTYLFEPSKAFLLFFGVSSWS